MTSRFDRERVRELFHAALDVPTDVRPAFVAQHAPDARLGAEVTSLLAAYAAAEGFLSDATGGIEPVRAAVRLQPGDRLGAFEIVALIGAGGMGEVYRARDTRLGRDVAIKVLSTEFGAGSLGRAQLEREARTIAALTHPRICTLHDVGVAAIGGAEATYLVMELLEGESLGERLRRGPLPLPQALSIAIEVAEALVAAHAHGIVHRDLKPANVMLSRDGAKLLDFGLARARAAAHGSTDVESPAMHASAVAGTPAYMAPEQLRGAAADARSDLFAFGAMLYEMISGRRAFAAASGAGVVSAILAGEPPPLSRPSGAVPPTLARLVSACLAKEPDERWQTARDLLRELRWMREHGDGASQPSSPPTGASRPRFALWSLAVLAAAAAITFGLLGVRASPAPTRVSFSIHPPPGTRFLRGAAEMAVSPDGSRLVFVALSADGRRKLWLRRFDAVDSREIDGSDDAQYPFWSPDGRSIAFGRKDDLVRIQETGGVAQVICSASMLGRGTWSTAGVILFAATGRPIQQVLATGGVPTAAIPLDPSRPERQQFAPLFLADGRRFVFLVQNDDLVTAELRQAALGSTGTRRVLTVDNGVAIAGRSLLTLSKGRLIARPYDGEAARVGDDPSTIAEGLVYDTPRRSGPAFSAGAGVVAFRSASPDSRLIWFDRTGRALGAFPVRADYHHPVLAPDGRRIAVEKTDPATGFHPIWVLDSERGTTGRLVADPSGAHLPVWSPDGRRVLFGSNRLGGLDLFETDADGGGAATELLASEAGKLPTDWSRDGAYLLYEARQRGQSRLMALQLSTKQAQPAVETEADEMQGQLSPDSRAIAYTSTAAGAPEVYVRRFPRGDGRWQASIGGGAQPQWRGDGRELFYLAPDGRLMAVDVRTVGGRVELGTPHALFATGLGGSLIDPRNQYAVTQDGQRFLVNLSAEDENAAPITVLMNWGAPRRP